MTDLTNEQIRQIYEKFAVLGQQITKVDTVVTRFDSAFEKLTEVSQTVSKILAVQESRMESQETRAKELQMALEARRAEVDEKIEKINNAIDKTETDLKTYVGTIRKEIFAHHAEMKKSISKIEKWMWTVVGGATTIIVLIGLVIKFIT